MINTTRLFRSSLLACLFCGASVASLLAQAPADQPPGGDHHHGPPPNVLFDALDANHDGVLSAEEIANAPAVLKGLLKEGETQLTRADLRPANKDGQMPPQRSEREEARAPRQPSGNDQTADDRPRHHRRMAMEDQETPSPWRHHFQHEEAGQRWERPARVQHEEERAEERPRHDFDREEQPDEPRHPRFDHPRRVEPRADERDEAGDARDMDQVLAALQGAATARHFMGLVSEQSLYNLTARTVELEVIPACRYHGLGFVPWSPLGAGMLGGALKKSKGGRDYQRAEKIDKLRPQVERYEALCEALGEEPADVAIAWLLHNPVVTAAVTGPRTKEQLVNGLRAVDVELSTDTLSRLDAIWPGPGGEAPKAYAW